jgi:hypothetical protein
MASELFQTLREKVPDGRVLVPGDEGFEDSLKRWSATSNKPAVSDLPYEIQTSTLEKG